MKRLVSRKKTKENFNKMKIKNNLKHQYFKREELLETIKKGHQYNEHLETEEVTHEY